MDINFKEEDFIKEIENLTPEEIKKILEFKSEYNNVEEKTEKFIDCPHEIIFNITANVLTQNEKSEVTGTREILSQNYHIPVPIDKDYKEYMKAFFNYLESNIINSIKHADNNTQIKDASNE